MSRARRSGMYPLQAHCHHGLGILYSQAGHAEKARVELSSVIGMYRNMEIVLWLPKTEATLSNIK